MTKTPKPKPAPTAVSTPASTRARQHRQSLAQTRLASASAGVKSVRRHKPRTPTADQQQQQQLRQVGLASFGFAKDSPAPATGDTTDTTTPRAPPQQQHRAKRRGRLPREEVEVPETQFGQSTQSPGFYNTTTNNDDAYSSPLSSPPPLPSADDDDVVGGVGSQASVSSRAAMPPPPVTPKRRKVLEIPDSKSPPVTPFSPFSPSQHQPGMQVQQMFSPTGRRGGRSPLKGVDIGAAAEGGGCGLMGGRTGRRLFATGPKRPREEEEDDTTKPQEPAGEKEPPPEAAIPAPDTAAPVNRDKTINSSQWWEVEEDAPLSTQATQTQHRASTDTDTDTDTDTETQDSIATVLLPESQKPAVKPGNEQETETETETSRVDLTYNEPDTEGFESQQAPESQDPTRTAAAAQEESQGSFHSMTYPPPHRFRDNTPDGNAPAESPPPPGVDAVDDTASEEDPDPDEEDAPHYKPYRTQQLPSSCWGTNTQAPQWGPEALQRRRGYPVSVSGDPSQWVAPEIVQLGEGESLLKDDADVEEGEDEGDDKVPSQFLPEPGDGEATPTQLLLETTKGRERKGEYKFRIPDEDDEEDITIATSQLLPSELMETFPMPPPLSQFSSYGYGDLSFETQ